MSGGSSTSAAAGSVVEEAAAVTREHGGPIRIGYARCSMHAQELAGQLDLLERAGCRRVFSEKISTPVKVRPELENALALAREIKHAAPDQAVILTVAEMKRLARNAAELITVAATVQAAGIQLELLTGPLTGIYDPTGMGSMLFAILAVAAQLDRDDIREKTLEGQKAAAARGHHVGRPPVIDPDSLIYARALRDAGTPVPEIATKLTIQTGKNAGRHPSLASVYRALAGPAPAGPARDHAHDVDDAPDDRRAVAAEVGSEVGSAGATPSPRPGQSRSATPRSGQQEAVGEPDAQASAEPAGGRVRRVVDLADQLGDGWQLVDQGEGTWQVHHDGAAVGIVRRSMTGSGRRGWLARLDNGIDIPAYGNLATAGSRLWRTRDLAAAGIAHHLTQQRPTRRRR